MTLADSMQSQDNINKVGHKKEMIKEDAKNMIYCLWIEWQKFPFADNINILPKKNWKYVSSDNQP